MAYVAGLHVGSVETCSPTEIKILLDSDAPQDMAFNTGRPQGFPRLNGYVLIPNEGGTVVAVIARMTMEAAPILSGGDRERNSLHIPVSRRRLFVTPLGTLEASAGGKSTSYELTRGVASYPAVGDAVVLPTAEQLRAIVEASGTNRRVTIGSARSALDAPVTIDPDKLFGRHVGVFGNTGSGKSCTVAGLVRWSLEAASQGHPSVAARFIVLDPNGEYRSCFADLEGVADVRVFSVEPRGDEGQLTVPAWMWNGDEWSGALDASPGTQRPILMQAIRQLRAAALHRGEDAVDRPQPAHDHILLSVKMRAYADYLQGLRAQGVAHLTEYRVFFPLHDNLRSLEDQLGTFLERLGAGADQLADAIDLVIETSREVRARRTDDRNGNEFKRHLLDGDLGEIVGVLEALTAVLPEPGLVGGPSEDTPSRFDITGLPGMVSLLAGLQAGNVQQHMAGLDLRLRTMLADNRIMPIIAPAGDQTSFVDWLHGLVGRGEQGRGQITVLDLSLVPSDVMTTLVAVLGRLVFEAAQRYRRAHGATLPTVIVLEEAHNFVQRQGPDSNESSPATRCRQMFEKIAKEGRKFGVGLMLSSQRPAELSPTIVAQCNSFVLHRIVNDRDQELVGRLAPDTSGTLLKELPSLPTQKAILMGIAAEIPLVFDVRPLSVERRPSSANPDFWGVWTGGRRIDHNLAEVAAAWTA